MFQRYTEAPLPHACACWRGGDAKEEEETDKMIEEFVDFLPTGYQFPSKKWLHPCRGKGRCICDGDFDKACSITT